jgi:hypothetical protein
MPVTGQAIGGSTPRLKSANTWLTGATVLTPGSARSASAEIGLEALEVAMMLNRPPRSALSSSVRLFSIREMTAM